MDFSFLVHNKLIRSLIPWNKDLLDKPTVSLVVRNYQHFVKPNVP